MTKPSETLWEIEPHTKAKHDILRRYLGAWFPILGSKIPRIVLGYKTPTAFAAQYTTQFQPALTLISTGHKN